MHTLPLSTTWLSELLPEGFPVGGSTLISGPGGSGKPLIGNTIVADWLRSGGTAAFVTLQYPDRSFIYRSMAGVTGIDLQQYRSQLRFVQLDLQREEPQMVDELGYAANLVEPEVWDEVLDTVAEDLATSGPGTLLFAAALNLLMFSPSYGEAITGRMEATLRDERFTTLFAASTKPMAEKVSRLEQAADNLIMSHRAEDSFTLYMSIERMKGVDFSSAETQVPIPSAELSAMKEVAEHSRKRVIPEVSRF